jgi:hypothetical protein
MINDPNTKQEEAERAATVEELELDWWQPLGCKCDVEFDE